MKTSIRPTQLKDPIAPGIEEHHFVSSFDGSEQTFLLKDFRLGTQAGPLVVIYLHGACSHQEQGMTSGIYGGFFESWGIELTRHQAVYVCPEYRGDSWMGPAAESDLAEIVRYLRQSMPVAKIILAGGSMGGTSTLIFAAHHSDMIDGVIALCPATDVVPMFKIFPEHFMGSYGGSPQEIPELYSQCCSRNQAETLARLPIAIVHGEADAVIPVEHSRILASRLQEAGGQCLYLEMPGGDHDAPVEAPFSTLLEFVLSVSPTKIQPLTY